MCMRCWLLLPLLLHAIGQHAAAVQMLLLLQHRLVYILDAVCDALGKVLDCLQLRTGHQAGNGYQQMSKQVSQ